MRMDWGRESSRLARGASSACAALRAGARKTGGLSHDEPGAYAVLDPRVVAGGKQAGEQNLDCLLSEVFARHPNCSKRWDGVLGKVDIIEANEGEIVRNPEPGFEQRMLNPDSRHVIRADDGGRFLFESQELLHRIAAAVQGVISLNDP